ncbi:MAG: hypothetical protein V3W44_05170 [Dehalococcoidales bacterium]
MTPEDLTHRQREVYFELRRHRGAATNHQLAKVAGHRFGARVFELNDLGFEIENDKIPPDQANGMKGVTLYTMLALPRGWKISVESPRHLYGESRVPEGAEAVVPSDGSSAPSSSKSGEVPFTPQRSTDSPRRTSTRPKGDDVIQVRKLPMPKQGKSSLAVKLDHVWVDDPTPMWNNTHFGKRCTGCGMLVTDPRNILWGCLGTLTRKAS